MAKRIILAATLLAVLGGAWYYLGSSTPAPEVKTETVAFETDPQQVVRLEVKTEGEEYAVYKQGETWLAEDKINVEILSVRMDMWLADIQKIVPQQVAEEAADDLEKYGLKTPVRSTRVVMADGGSETLMIGAETPDKSGLYFKTGSSKAVYVISWRGKNEYAPMFMSLRTMDIMSAYDIADIYSTAIYNRREDITYEFKHIDDLTEPERAEDFVSDNTVNYWKMVKPFVATAIDEKLTAGILQKLTAIWADDYIDDNPTDLAKYGLAEPDYTITLKMKSGETKTIYVGRTVDIKTVADAARKVFVRAADKPNVFACDREYISFVYDNMFNYLSSIPVITKLAGVKSVNISLGGSTHKIDRDGFILDGRAISEDVFKDIYRSIISLTAYGVYEESTPPDGKALGGLTFTMEDGSRREITFTEINERSSVIKIDGKPNFYILTKYVNAISDAINNAA